MSDELASINGIKPNRLLDDGEEVEAKSQSSKSVYRVKRTLDHYYCSCPAWRNQARIPVYARTCKHLRSILGDKYEDARLKLKNPDSEVPVAKGKGKAASTSKNAKPTGSTKSKPVGRKRKARGEDDEEEDEEIVGEEDDERPPKRTRTTRSGESSATTARGRGRGGSRAPTRRLKNEDEDEEEVADEKPASKKSRLATKSAKGDVKVDKDLDVDEKAGADEGDVIDVDPDVEVAVDSHEEDEVKQVGENGDDASEDREDRDELQEINGIKPKVFMKEGDETEVSSMTSSSKYKVKRTMDHYYCTCPAWRNQSAHPVSARTCKHLRSLLGDAYEEARLRLKNPNGPAATATKSTSKGRNGSTSSAKKKAPEVLLAVKWDEESTDPTGWWVSEKLDGVRTLWAPKGGEGKEGAMLSRLGNPFMVPKEWMDKLPKDVTLDGELFGGRGEFQSTVGIVKTMGSKGWKNITFQIFDVPSMGNEPFEDRLQWLQENFGEGGKYHSKEFVVVDQTCAESKDHVFDILKEVEAHGGEGMMLRKPGSKYEGRRSSTLLKIKTFFDAEAEVTGYVPGKGKHTGSTGALKCKMASGKTFAVGSGLSDRQRARPPKVGTIIVYRFQELTKDGVPRFPTFVGEAADKIVAKDAEVPASRKV